MTTTELTNNEKALLAREVAADGHDTSEYEYEDVVRRTFCAGWDAAMEYAGKKASEGIEHLDAEVVDG